MDNGKILAGGTGSGKSHTAIAYYFTKILGGVLPEDNGGLTGAPKHHVPLYIITTAKKRDSMDWQRIISQFALGPFSEQDKKIVPKSYIQSITVDSFNNIKKYRDVQNAFFIFDEQRLSGSGAWADSFIRLAKNNRWVLLSATPGDSWVDYIPVFIANGFYRNRTHFKQKHIVYNYYAGYPKIDRYVEVAPLYRFRKQILVPMPAVRHTTPRRVYWDVDFDSAKTTKLQKDRWNIFENQPVANASELFSLLRKVLYSDPSRLEAVVEIMDHNPKVIIFYNFNYELEILRGLETRLDIPMAEWNGHKHEPIPKGNRWVYLVQYIAGSEAWECIDTDTIIFYSLNYSWRMTKQCEGRIDRLNTSFHILNYYYLTSKHWLDRAVRQAHKDKKTFNERDTGITFT